MDFDAVETGKNRAAYAVAKFGNHAFDFFTTEGARHGGAVARRGNGARRHRLATTNQLWVNHAAAVVNLQNRFRAFRFYRFGDFRQSGDFFIVINANSAREGQTIIINKAAFNDDSPDAAGTGAIVFNELAGDGTIEITGAGGHWRH